MFQQQAFPFAVRTLVNDKVKLVPFNAELHAEAYFSNTTAHPELYAHMPLGPFATQAEFVEKLLQRTSGQNPEWITFAVIDKTRSPSSADEEGELAGMMTFLNTSATHSSTEIGPIVVLPQYHRTHVTTNAVGLMLQFALGDLADGGMGLRRVEWQASSTNAASIRVAERLGFQREGLLRWHYVFRGGLQTGKVGNGRALPQGSPEGDLGRDTVVLSLCWDDWQNGAKDVVQKAMDRTK